MIYRGFLFFSTLNLLSVAPTGTISLGRHILHLIYRPHRGEGKMRAMTPPHKVSHIKQTEWAGTKALLAERALSDLKLGLENEHYSSADIPPRQARSSQNVCTPAKCNHI